MDRVYAPWRAEYLGQDRSSQDCIFCSKARESADEENGILHRNESWFVILNLYPYTSGHLMIVPYRHVSSLEDLDDGERGSLADLLVRCEAALRKAYRPHGLNVGLNLGEAAGAGILGHLHFHVVPRWRGDSNFMTSVAETRVVSEEMRESFRRLAKHFDGGEDR
jgi:ATP adenylyltransferase